MGNPRFPVMLPCVHHYVFEPAGECLARCFRADSPGELESANQAVADGGTTSTASTVQNRAVFDDKSKFPLRKLQHVCHQCLYVFLFRSGGGRKVIDTPAHSSRFAR